MTSDRRAFLRFLAASPYVAALGGISAYSQIIPELAGALGDPKDALNVTDFEEAAHRRVLPGHWANISSGVDDDLTMRANRDAYRHIQLRPSRLHDGTKVDMKVDLFGATYNSPIYTCPASGEGAFHPEGELAVGRATKARGTMQMLSTMASNAVEDVNAAHGQPVWFQFYAPTKWEVVQAIVHRVEAAGCPVIALTVDSTTGRNTETFSRTRPKSTFTCSQCHGPTGPLPGSRKIYKGIDMTGVGGQDASMTWDFVDKLRKIVSVKLFIKGIDTKQDAKLCLEHGIDGIVVSNHGGRSTETLRPTIQALPEVTTEVAGRIPVFVDGGVRRGTDVFKALALGATAVGIGRPFLWGLGAFGQAGVDRVLEILQGELRLAMANCGTQNVKAINRSFVELPEHWI